MNYELEPVKRVRADKAFKHLFGDNEVKPSQKRAVKLTIDKMDVESICLHLALRFGRMVQRFYRRNERDILVFVIFGLLGVMIVWKI